MKNRSNILPNQNEFDIIQEFELYLEHIFATETKVIICDSETGYMSLAIEIDSGFSLSEIITLLKMNSKNNSEIINLDKIVRLFINAVNKLSESLIRILNIEEVSIYFKKTSINIHSISRNSIIEEVDYLVKAIVFHYDYYSAIMDQVPNEIHIPVLVDNTTKEIFRANKMTKDINTKSPYSLFWGLYFDSINHPMIYNVTRANIMPGELDLFLD